jgi:hypothetical protein
LTRSSAIHPAHFVSAGADIGAGIGIVVTAAAVFLGESRSARLVAACAMLCVYGCEIADRNGS